MKPGRHITPEALDLACERLIEEARSMLCEEVHTVYDLAVSAAYAAPPMPNYGLKPQQYEYAKEEARRAAAELFDYDCLLLARAARANLAAAAAIDPADENKQLRDGTYLGDRYRHYRLVSDIIEDVLREKAAEEYLKGVEQDDEDRHR